MKHKMKKIKAWAISSKGRIGFITCDSKTILAGKKCKDYILHTSKKNAVRDLEEIYDPTGLEVVQVLITPIQPKRRK